MYCHQKVKCLCDTMFGLILSGTSSLRRTAQLNRSYPDLKIENIRGNINTRLNKLDNGDSYAAVVLASAGLSRMGWENRISQVSTEMWILILTNVVTGWFTCNHIYSF